MLKWLNDTSTVTIPERIEGPIFVSKVAISPNSPVALVPYNIISDELLLNFGAKFQR